MKRRVLFRENSDEAELINLTPLLDVLFLILVFFILIAPLLDFDRLQLAASSDNKQELSALNAKGKVLGNRLAAASTAWGELGSS